MSRIFALILITLCTLAQPAASDPVVFGCDLVDPYVPTSCSGAVVSIKFWGDARTSPIITPQAPTYTPIGFPANPTFHKKYPGTFLECSTVFDVYGPGVIGGDGKPVAKPDGNSWPGGGSWHHAIAVDGVVNIIVSGPAPANADVYAATNRLFTSASAGDHKIEIYAYASGTEQIVMSPYSVMDCREIWLHWQ